MLFLVCALTVQPTLGLCMAMQEETCCVMMCEEETSSCTDETSCDEEELPCEEEAAGKCCMSGICNPCAICYCCCGDMNDGKIEFVSSASTNDLIATEHQNARAGFLSSPFQPPELNYGLAIC